MLRRIEAKKEKRKKLWMGAVLVFLMGFSMLGILVGSRGEDKWEYNGFKFTRTENIFLTKIGDEKIGFNFLPQTLSNINVSVDLKNKLSLPMFYITFDPESDIQNLLYIDTIRRDLQINFDAIIISGKTKESETYKLPIVNCQNATQFVPVFYFNVSNQTSIVESNNCIILNGQLIEFFKLRDFMLYTYYGVLNG